MTYEAALRLLGVFFDVDVLQTKENFILEKNIW